MPYDVVIVGGGPAGLSAALALRRARKTVLICDAGAPRTQAAAGVHNFTTRDGITPRALGHIEIVCTYTIGINRQCRGTLFMPRGKIVVGGTMRYRSFHELAILGGTGLYDNARGTLTVTRIGRRPARHILFFRLVG